MGGLLEKCQLAFALFGLIFFRGKRRSKGERKSGGERERMEEGTKSIALKTP